MASQGYPVSRIGTLFSRISSHAPVLCLRLPSTPCFYTVRDQAPGRTSLLSFVSDVAVFADPLPLRDCGFDPFRPSAEGLTEQWPGASRTRNVCRTVLLPMPRDCGWLPAHPRKSSRDHVAATFQGLWKITTRIWHQALPLMTLFQHQQMWLFSQVHWGLAFGGPTQPLSGVLLGGEPPLPMWSEEPGLHSAPGDSLFPPEHCHVLSCRVSDSVLPLFIVLMEFKPSPFSFLPF